MKITAKMIGRTLKNILLCHYINTGESEGLIYECHCYLLGVEPPAK